MSDMKAQALAILRDAWAWCADHPAITLLSGACVVLFIMWWLA